MNSNRYDLQVLVNGKPVQEYQHEGSTYIEGRKKSSYQIRFKNNSGERVLVVPSVDGLSVLDGQQAGTESPGYVVDGYGTLEIPGWWLNDSSVAKFEFGDKSESYTHQSTGSSMNVGGIGVRVYGEERPKVAHPAPSYPSYPPSPYRPWKYPPRNPRYPWLDDPYSNGIYCSASSANGSNVIRQSSAGTMSVKSRSAGVSKSAESLHDIGTVFGSKAEFNTSKVTFNRGSLLCEMAIYYDSRRNLERRGIQIVSRPVYEAKSKPSLFPADGCKPPPNWKG